MRNMFSLEVRTADLVVWSFQGWTGISMASETQPNIIETNSQSCSQKERHNSSLQHQNARCWRKNLGLYTLKKTVPIGKVMIWWVDGGSTSRGSHVCGPHPKGWRPPVDSIQLPHGCDWLLLFMLDSSPYFMGFINQLTTGGRHPIYGALSMYIYIYIYIIKI